jgi:RNA polymerase-binding protein DksA
MEYNMAKVKKTSTKKKTTKKGEKTPTKVVKASKKSLKKPITKKIAGIKPIKTFNKDVLEHFKKIITTQKQEMAEEIESLNDRMMDSTTREFTDTNSVYSLHMADQGTDAMEREKTFLLAQRSDDHIRRLDEALRRIEDGTYGICIVCEKLIEKERLEAVPTTQKHVDCKNKMKRLNNESTE